MDKHETELAAGILLNLSAVITALDNMQKLLTSHIIQKGTIDAKNPDHFDPGRH